MPSRAALVRSARSRAKAVQRQASAPPPLKSNGRVRFVLCVDNGGDDFSLDVGRIYRALPTEKIARDIVLLRVIDNEGEDYLYPKGHFVEVKLPRAAREAVLRAR